MIRMFTSLGILACLLLWPGIVAAHRPLFVPGDNTTPEEAVEVQDPAISWAIYSELAQGEVHYYRLELAEETEIFAQITSPANNPFKPTLTLLGTGLPDADGLPLTIPPGMGAISLETGDFIDSHFEPFTQTRYLLGPELRERLAPGSYYLAVWHPEGQPGRYALAVGEEEVWTWRDIVKFPGMWFRARWWYSPGQTVAVLALAVAFLAGGGYLWLRH